MEARECKSKGDGMSCRHCTSDNQREFGAEMNVHYRQLKEVDKSPLLVCTQALACLDCGFTEFTLVEEDLRLLSGNDDVPQISVAVGG
jgi:hypothetical protein